MRVHGHNWVVRAYYEFGGVDDKGLTIDYLRARAGIEKVILTRFDHRHLNDIPPFDKLNPTSENIAAEIFRLLRDEFRGKRPQRTWCVTVKADKTQGAVVLLSGGLDSTVSLAMASGLFRIDTALFIDYGQLGAGREQVAANAVASHYGIPLRVIPIPWLGAMSASSLTGAGEIPRFSGRYRQCRPGGCFQVGLGGEPQRDSRQHRGGARFG